MRGSRRLVRPGWSTRLLLVAAALVAAAVPPRSAAGASPQAVASWAAPRLNAYWSFVFAKQGLTYRNPPYYYWYNRPGYGWLHTPRQCDIYRKRDGVIWAGFSREYAPNSFYCPANDDFYFDWSLWKTLRRGAAVVVAGHEWGAPRSASARVAGARPRPPADVRELRAHGRLLRRRVREA